MPLAEPHTIKLNRRAVVVGAASSLPIVLGTVRSWAATVAFTVSEFGSNDDEITGCFARGINRKATVVGITTDADRTRAVRSGGKSLRFLPDDQQPGIANAINDSGLIVGAVGDLAAAWADDLLSMLTESGTATTIAYGVNAEGLIVGSAETGANRSIAVAWVGAEVIELPSLGGSASRAVGVNRDGTIVGYSTLDDEGATVRAVRWIDGSITDLGTVGGKVSEAAAINTNGDIVGSSSAAGGFSAVDHAFVRQGETMAMLARLDPVRIQGRTGKVKLDQSRATGISHSGEICGYSMSVSENDPISIATLWIDGSVFDLNSLIGKSSKEIVLTSADGINADRELVCTGYFIGDEQRSRVFRLHPE